MPTECPLSLNVPHCTERPARPRSPLVLNARHNLFVAPVKRARRVLGKKERLIPMSKKLRLILKMAEQIIVMHSYILARVLPLVRDEVWFLWRH